MKQVEEAKHVEAKDEEQKVAKVSKVNVHLWISETDWRETGKSTESRRTDWIST